MGKLKKLWLEPLKKEKLQNFGYKTEVNGHDVNQLFKYFKKLKKIDQKPTALICHTIKGKGFHFTETIRFGIIRIFLQKKRF